MDIAIKILFLILLSICILLAALCLANTIIDRIGFGKSRENKSKKSMLQHVIGPKEEKYLSFNFSKINEEGFYIYVDEENAEDLFKLNNYMINSVKFKGYVSYHEIINHLVNGLGYSCVGASAINKDFPDLVFHSVYDVPTICDDIYPVGDSEETYCYHIHLPSML